MPATRAFIAALALCAAIAFAASARAADPPVISVGSDHILVDGQPIFLRGVDYSPFIAGDAPWTSATKVDFRKDLHDIKEELHANAVRVYDPLRLPADFYDAARDEGLWVIQGIFLPSPPDLIEALPQAKELVQAAHEHVHAMGGADRVLAWVLGSGVLPSSVAQTISTHQARPRFQGSRYRVPAESRLPPVDRYAGCDAPPLERFDDPHPFQSYLAELAQHLSDLEAARLRPRPLIGHASTSLFSPILGARDRDTPHPVDLSFLDVIFENVFSYEAPYLAYFGFAEYVERMKRFYPRNPVVVLETGYSTSATQLDPRPPLCGFPYRTPAPHTLAFGGASEEEQAEALEARYVDVVASPVPLAGFFVFSYYEEWWYDGKVDAQDPAQPLEWFGILRVRGTPASFTVSRKPAYDKLADLFSCEEPDAPTTRCGIVLRSPRLLEARYGKPLDVDLLAAGGILPYRWTLLEGDLPAGVTLEPSGKLSGTPERWGDFRFRLRVEGWNSSRERVQVLRVTPPRFTIDREDRLILMDGEPFFLKGIDYSPFIAGDAPWTAMEIADPDEDLREIKEDLHANAIRLYQTVPRTVYDAARKHGLFVIQGIHLQVEGPHPGACDNADPSKPIAQDLLRPENLEPLKRHVLAEVDEVERAGGMDSVLCLVVGNEVNFCSQKKTILENQARPRYQGIFYSAPPPPARLPVVDAYPGCPAPLEGFTDPHPFQSLIAELADLAARRQVAHRGEHSLVGHATDPNMSLVPSLKDRFAPQDHFPVDMGFLDIVFQNTYSYFPPYIRFLGFRNYLERCAEAYPRTPFVLLECGFNTLPGVGPDECATGPVCGQPATPVAGSLCFFGGNTEEEQARGMWERWEETVRDPPVAAGFFAFELYDEWWKAHDRSQYVQDLEPEEWFGLKRVSGTREVLAISRKPAFETVARMFDTGWCAGRLSCAVLPDGSVELILQDLGDRDEVVLERDGAPLAVLDAQTTSYTDARPPAGLRAYRAVARKAHVECPALACEAEVPSTGGKTFRRGDADADGRIELTDPVRLLNFLFLGQARPECLDAADVDDDGAADISDAVGSLGYQFLGGAPPAAPGPTACGLDPTAEAPDLGCEAACP